MNEEQLLEQFLTQQHGCNYIRCRKTQGFWIIEMVINDIDDNTRDQILINIQDQVTNQRGQFETVWKAFIYNNDNDRFAGQGTLHTVDMSYSMDGIPTTTLAGQDCYADITEFDEEILQLGPPRNHVVIGKETVDGNNHPILPFVNAPNIYRWLEAVGGNYGIDDNGAVATGNQSPKNITITLRN